MESQVVQLYVLQKLKLGWSPEQKAGGLPLDCPGLSIITILTAEGEGKKKSEKKDPHN
ncbi:MAG: hypothetical protein OS130_05745 [Thermodesulfobacteriota bacterium]|jgi:hypothetical protein|nr:MAG: hypothetical protein OS130_05745 [Thermodesulfobacteriota bacterium]